MLPLTRFLLTTGVILAMAGTAAAAFGGMRLHRFLTHTPITGVSSTSQFALWVVMPPVLISLGFGLLVFGIIMIAKGIHFHLTQQRASRPEA